MARNANPIATPASTSHRVAPRSCALTTQYAATVSSSTSNASGLLNRNISTATGVSAIAAPASSPAQAEADLRTEAYTIATEPTPISACGTRIAHEFSPNRRTLSTIGHSEAGVLSTVIAPAASEAPKKNAFQLWLPACTAAE